MGRVDASSYPELFLIILTGVLHVSVELAWGAGMETSHPGRPEQLYNLLAVGLWGVYALWRAVRTPGLAHRWGFRRDNFLPALRACLVFVIPAAAAMIVAASLTGRLALPPTFWVVLLLYPLYGIAQQFALQALITRNLRALVRPRAPRVVVVAALFGAAHVPDGPLIGLTLLTGLVFTWIYESHPNLWAVGIAHGLLGALAYYLVLGRDPAADLLRTVGQLT